MATTPKQIRNFNEKQWVSKSEAARLRGISRQAIWELVRRGRLVPAAHGGRMYLRRSDVMTFKYRKRGRPPGVSSPKAVINPTNKRLDPTKWFSIMQAAHELDLTHQAITDLVRRGRLRALASDGKNIILRSSLEKFKAERTIPDPAAFPKPEWKQKDKN